MIPASQLQALRQSAREHPAAVRAEQHLDAISALLSDELPFVEQLIARASDGPRPINEATRQLVFAGGKRIRPVLALALARACGRDTSRCIALAAAAELVHSAALLHDDVIDEGTQRRGRPASRILWGNLISVLSGDLLLTSALALIQDSGVPGALDDMLDTTRAMIRGEVMQLQARNSERMGASSYLDIIRDKTASLFAYACRMGARSVDADPAVIDAVGRFGEHFGVTYQIIDDVLDIEASSREVGKQTCRDLLEGKTTLPLTLALKEGDSRLVALIDRARQGDSEAAREAASLPLVREACVEARAYGLRETEKGVAYLNRVPDCRERELLMELSTGLVERRI